MRVLRRVVPVLLAGALLAPPAVAAPDPLPSNPRVTIDKYSFKVDGRRVLLNSGEVHYSRMPDPREEMDAGGYPDARWNVGAAARGPVPRPRPMAYATGGACACASRAGDAALARAPA